MQSIKLCLVLIILSTTAFSQEIELLPFASGFERPVGIENVGDSRLFVVEQRGKILIVDSSGNINPVPFLDISDRVDFFGEKGLLGLAFHPNYAVNGFFYVNYTDVSGDTHISRFERSSTNPDSAEADSEQLLIFQAQPFPIHNGGDLNFGPDGYLYIALGDGGFSVNGQDSKTLLGSLLRIDVDGGSPYAIPPDNPFVGDTSVLDEIWAFGLRNPWRFSFDALNGDLWIADVGANSFEEINFIASGNPGGQNYGWPCYEADSFTNFPECLPDSEFVSPLFYYPHGNGVTGIECSITGGLVYRGTAYPELTGQYIYSDYCEGNFWILSVDSLGNIVNKEVGEGLNFDPTAFGFDKNKELYVTGTASQTIYQIRFVNCPVPQNLMSVNMGGSISLSWDEVTPANSYMIQGRKVGGSASSKTLSNNMLNIGALSAGNYQWRVRAQCSSGVSDYSGVMTFTIP